MKLETSIKWLNRMLCGGWLHITNKDNSNSKIVDNLPSEIFELNNADADGDAYVVKEIEYALMKAGWLIIDNYDQLQFFNRSGELILDEPAYEVVYNTVWTDFFKDYLPKKHTVNT